MKKAYLSPELDKVTMEDVIMQSTVFIGDYDWGVQDEL
jgi:hypothetical protein